MLDCRAASGLSHAKSGASRRTLPFWTWPLFVRREYPTLCGRGSGAKGGQSHAARDARRFATVPGLTRRPSVNYNVGSHTPTAATSAELSDDLPRSHCRPTAGSARFVGPVGRPARRRAAPFRPPAVPLVTIDPYTSCWSMADRLYDEWPKHWTGQTHAMCGLIRVDGKPLRFMGDAPEVPEAIEQQSVVVRATRSIYNFAAPAST